MGTEDRVVRDNWGLVVEASKKYSKRFRGVLDKHGLESAASLGLLKAVRKYNPSKGKLSTIAYRCILTTMIDDCRRRTTSRRGGDHLTMQMLYHGNKSPETWDYDPPEPTRSCYSIYEDIQGMLTWSQRVLTRLVYWEGYSAQEAGIMMGHCRSWGPTIMKTILNKVRANEKVLVC